MGLNISSYGASKKKIESVASGLVSAIKNADGTITLTYTDGSVINTGVVTGKSAYEYARDNGYLGTETSFGKELTNISNTRELINDNLIKIETSEQYVTKNVDIIKGYFDRTTETYEMGNSYRSAMVEVVAGEKYRLSGCDGSSSKKAFLMKYDGTTWSNVVYTSAKTSHSNYEYTIPSGISKICVHGFSKTDEIVVEKWESVTTTTVYFEKNVLNGKKLGVIGDSICYGNGYRGGYGKIIAEKNNMTLQNLGIGSTSIIGDACASTVITLVNGVAKNFTTLTNGSFDASLIDFSKTDDFGTIQYCKRSWNNTNKVYDIIPITEAEWNGTDELYIVRHSIPDRIQYLDSDCDYVIAEGGINDITATPFGTITDGYDAVIDKNTICGGMELLCRNMIDKFEGKKLGFIFVHKAKDYPFIIKENGKGTMTEYFNKMKEVLNKYSIPYLDLYNDSALNTGISGYLKYTMSSDGVHPTQDGYEKFYVPKIEAWLKSL